MNTSADEAILMASARKRNSAIAEGAYGRIEVYALLAALLRQPPDTNLLARLADMPVPAAEPEESGLTTAWRKLRNAAGNADSAAVDDEFHQLFIGLGRGEVLPYASWYLSGFLMDRPLVAIRSDLARLGIARSADNKEPEDHVAALCETMILLADPQAGVDGQQQSHFLNMHMTSWMGRLFSDIENAEGADFYRSVAGLGAAFLVVEKSWLSLP